MDAPIGVFDSGIGGLIVLRHLQAQFPGESFIYLGDTARIPYGSKSAKTIAKYSERNIEFLLERGVKAVVIACNSASSVLHEIDPGFLKKAPIYNVIEPVAEKALQVSTKKKVGVIATRATVESEAYPHRIKKFDGEAEVFQMACPLLVPLVEEGWDDDPITNLIVYRYLSPLVAQGVDSLILGCTHYPYLKKAIQKVTGTGITLIDSGEAVTEKLFQDFESGVLKRTHRAEGGGLKILASDTSSTFEKLARTLMGPKAFREIEHVDI